MEDFSLGLMDKLFLNKNNVKAEQTASVLRLSLDELKDSVARDLEDLLNTRMVNADARLAKYPEVSKSIAAYGLNDFSGLSLASTDDRTHICRSLEQAILKHEPRLKNVQAEIEIDETAINKLNFFISAMLIVNPIVEPVSFDAVLKTTSLQYSIRKARRNVNRAIYG
jgi:type VI secretion system protein ImpF